MKVAEVQNAFLHGQGTKINARLFFLNGVFYERRRGAVPFVKAKEQDRLAHRYGMAMEMAKHREFQSIRSEPTAKVVALMSPPKQGRRGWVQDFLATYQKQKVA